MSEALTDLAAELEDVASEAEEQAEQKAATDEPTPVEEPVAEEAAPAVEEPVAEETAPAEEVVAEAKARDASVVNLRGTFPKLTPYAAAYAVDKDVDLTGIRGTGAEGNILVGDVEKLYKSQLAAAAAVDLAPAQLVVKADEPKEEVRPEPVPTRAPRTAAQLRESAQAAMFLPSLAVGMEKFKHISRTITDKVPIGVWSQPTVHSFEADKRLSEMLEDGWVFMHIDALEVNPEGIHMLWLMGKPRASLAEAWLYKQVRHVSRAIGAPDVGSMALTPELADATIEGYFVDGWDLAHTEYLTAAPGGGLTMMYVFVR